MTASLDLRIEVAENAMREIFHKVETEAKRAQELGYNFAYSPVVHQRRKGSYTEMMLFLNLQVNTRVLKKGELAPAGWTFVQLQEDPN